jgi:hypothetical protein
MANDAVRRTPAGYLADLEQKITMLERRIVREADTGWINTGLTLTAETGWSLSSYRLRKVGSRVYGQVELSRTGADLTVSAGGDLTDTTILTMPEGWRNGMGFDAQVFAQRPGISMFNVAANSTGFRLLGGLPGVTLPTGATLRVYANYLTD